MKLPQNFQEPPKKSLYVFRRAFKEDLVLKILTDKTVFHKLIFIYKYPAFQNIDDWDTNEALTTEMAKISKEIKEEYVSCGYLDESADVLGNGCSDGKL